MHPAYIFLWFYSSTGVDPAGFFYGGAGWAAECFFIILKGVVGEHSNELASKQLELRKRELPRKSRVCSRKILKIRTLEMPFPAIWALNYELQFDFKKGKTLEIMPYFWIWFFAPLHPCWPRPTGVRTPVHPPPYKSTPARQWGSSAA